jgi:Ca-activated chloride channel family protein
LNPADLFNVVVFRDHPRYFQDTPVPAKPEHLRAASEFISNLEAVGATDVYSAVRPILARPPTAGVPAIVFVASDGRPTGDNLSGRDLINALTADNTHRVPIYTFGGGNTVNRYLLDLLAYRNKGTAEIVDDIDEIREALPRFFSRFSDAILVDLHADFGRIPRDEVFPREIPDFYRGQVVTLYGRFVPDEHGRFVVRLEGNTGESRKEIVLTATLKGAQQGDRQIAHDWAFQKSYHIIGEMTRVGATPELQAELQELNQEYGVRTAYSE